MEFTGLAAPLSPTGLQSVATTLGVDLATVWAVATVETRSCGFFANRKPQILFERHVFHRLTNGAFDAQRPDLSNPTPGGYSDPSSDQYVRLQQAIALDESAALRSASWGIGQVMGFNAAKAGFADAAAMVAAFLQGEDAQFQAAAQFIVASGLASKLANQDWAGYALGYNGANYKQNAYDDKLKLAHARFSVGPLPDLHTRAVQLALMLVGKLAANGIDGLFGNMTQQALLSFQGDAGLSQTGRPDDATVAALVGKLGWGQV